MSVVNKTEIEEEIINRYLNKEINVLEKEMALNIFLACNKPSNKHFVEEIASFANMILDTPDKKLVDIPVKKLVDIIIGFGRANFNSDKFNQEEIEELALLALKQREDYEL